MKALIIGGGIFLFFAVFGFIIFSVISFSYNGLVDAQESAHKSWGEVQNVYQRRYDLIPNLVKTVQGYASHEEKVLREVTEARSKVGQVNLQDLQNNPETQKKFMENQAELGQAISRLLVVAEKYPDLKAAQNFLNLQDELAGTENRIAFARNANQQAVEHYNRKVREFPSNFIASHYDFKTMEYFQVEKGVEKAPEVKF